MRSIVRTFLTGLIDYAGLFPPARLELAPALETYDRERAGDEAWMLARFLIPAVRLGELDPFVAELSADDRPLRLGIIGRGGGDAEAFLDAVEEDADTIRSALDRHGGALRVEGFEVRLPDPVVAAAGAVATADIVGRALTLLDRVAPDGLQPFFEAGFVDGWSDAIPAAADAIATAGRSAGRRRIAAPGMKIRCGGLEPAAFPSSAQVACALVAGRDVEVPLKATAGLHHPLRHRDEEMGVWRHGFLNLVSAATMAIAHDLGPAAVAEILDETDAASFRFTEDELHAGALAAPEDAVGRARSSLITSYGSCSFDEPRDDLRALGLLPEDGAAA